MSIKVSKIFIAVAVLLAAHRCGFAQGTAQVRDDAPVYVMILDRSGSMLEKEVGDGGKVQTRWERLQEQVSTFIAGRDAGAVLKLIVFEPTQADPEPIKIQEEIVLDSAQTIQLWTDIAKRNAPWNPRLPLNKRGFGQPSTGATPLYLSMRNALDYAIEYSQDGRNRPIAVCVFTDGADDYKDRNGRPIVAQQELMDRCHRLEKLNENARYVFVNCKAGPVPDPLEGCPLAGKTKPPTRFIPASVSPKQITLLNPRVAATQSFELTLNELSTADLELLKGKSFTCEFVADAGDPIQAKIVGALVSSQGPQRLQIEVSNAAQLAGDREYRGTIHVTPPELERYRIDGLERHVAVVFQKGELPHIDRVEPSPNTTFLISEPVNCRVWTLQDATIEWDFGEAGKGTGAQTPITFQTPGDKPIKVTVKDRFGQTATAQTSVRVVDAGLSVQPPRGIVFERSAAGLQAKSWGGVTDVQWRINGQAIEGAKQPTAELSALQYAFPAAMRYNVRAVGKLGDRLIRSADVTLDARPVEPIVRGPKDEIRYRRPTEFTLVCDAPAESVTWDFGDPGGATIAESKQSAVREFRKFGSHRVAATITLPGGETVSTPELYVNVLRKPATLDSQVNYAGRAAASYKRIKQGSVVELSATPGGDIDVVEWTIATPSGRTQRLGIGDKSFELAELGHYDFKAVATGPPDDSGAVMTVERRFLLAVSKPPAHWLTIIICLLLSALLVFLLYLSVGNGPTQWRLAVAPDTETLDRMAVGRPVGTFWSRLRKTALLPLARYVAEPYFKQSPGVQEKLTLSKVRAPNARGALGLDVPGGNQRFRPMGGNLDAQTYEMVFPDVRRTDEGGEDAPQDAPDKTVFVRLFTSAKIPKADVILFVCSLIVVLAAAGGVYWFVENYTGI